MKKPKNKLDKYLSYSLNSAIGLFVLAILSLIFSISIHTLSILQLPTLAITNLPNKGIISEVSSDNINDDRFLQRGQSLYQEERFREAVETFQKAATAYEAEGDILRQSLALNYVASAWEKLGFWQEAKSAIVNSLSLLQNYNSGTEKDRNQVIARIYNTQGRIQLVTGQTEDALTSWQKANKYYTQIGDEAGIIGTQINQAQALKVLGFYSRSWNILKQVEKTLNERPNSVLKATGLRSLGNTLRMVGKLDESLTVLKESLRVAMEMRSPHDISATLLSLGNTERAIGNTKIAIQVNAIDRNPLATLCLRNPAEGEAANHYRAAANYYQEAANESASKINKAQAEVNYLRMLLDNGELPNQQKLLEVKSNLLKLSPSRSAIYAKVNFSQSFTCLKQKATKNLALKEVTSILNTAIEQAKAIEDERAAAYVLGNLGQVYEYEQQFDAAKEYTKAALNIAQKINADDIAYQWNWQLGRLILQNQGDKKNAIAAYLEAFNSLQKIRSDIVTLNPDIQFTFREEVEPIYRKLADLVLQENALEKAREVIEALQLAELDNFFRDACLNAKEVKIDQIDSKAAVIYTIILPDRLEAILSLPGENLHRYTTPLSEREIEIISHRLRKNLRITEADGEGKQLFLSDAQKLYNWLIRPIEPKLSENQIKTLVFVLDGSLRNLPMAVLNDGNEYLVEKYNISIAPGLRLLNPQPLAQKQLKALTAGATNAPSFKNQNPPFGELLGVGNELQQIQSQIPTKELFEQKFTESNFQQAVNQTAFPIIHIATHGKFSSIAEDTFILTYDDRLDANELNNLLRSREEIRLNTIELLVLSACETAQGDPRAALGLAGVAVRAGARSTLATLWKVDDNATAVFMGQFYRELEKNRAISKAEALHNAQQFLLKNPQYNHPNYWAAFVLVGNWL